MPEERESTTGAGKKETRRKVGAGILLQALKRVDRINAQRGRGGEGEDEVIYMGEIPTVRRECSRAKAERRWRTKLET